MGRTLKFKKNGVVIFYEKVPHDPFPHVMRVISNSDDLSSSILKSLPAIKIGFDNRPPWRETVTFPGSFDKVLDEFFNVVAFLQDENEKIWAVSLSDHFFNFLSKYWGGLVQKQRSKNLASKFLEEAIVKVRSWEDSHNRRVHKGTPYFLLTSLYLSMGDIDSAYASTFKAIVEDRISKGEAIGDPHLYRKSPAYRYVSLEDNQANYLYNLVLKMRNFLNAQIFEFNKASVRVSGQEIELSMLDKKFFDNTDLEEIMFIFVYCIENFLKYKGQFGDLVIGNEFYQLRNASSIFDLCLVTDKILELKYGSRFPEGQRTIGRLVWSLFDDKRWIQNIRNAGQLKRALTPSPFREPDQSVPDLLAMNISINNNPISVEMTAMVLAWSLRNWGAHRIKRQKIFVTQYYGIVKWLIWSILVSVEAL